MVLGQDTPDGMVGITSTGTDSSSSMGLKSIALVGVGLWIIMKVMGDG
jgi:hypothetical protein